MLYSERGRQSTGIIISSQSRALRALELFTARSTVSSSPALSTLITLMATETLIVQIIQFTCTRQCAADPSLFEAVSNIVQSWQ